MIQHYRRIKTDVNDTLYSKIIRYGHTRCLRCRLHKNLQCAHIIGRSHKTTRWMLRPVKSSIPLCSDCHDWFDRSKDDTPLFNEKAREFFMPEKNAYMWLVYEGGYSWEELLKLYYLGHRTQTNCGAIEKKEITRQLKAVLKQLEFL